MNLYEKFARFKIPLVAVLLLATASTAAIDFRDSDINFHDPADFMDSVEFQAPVEFQSPVDMNDNRVENVGDPSGPEDAATASWSGQKFVNASGDELTGDLNLSGNQIKEIGDPSEPSDAVSLEYLQNNAPGSKSPIYGDGSDGEIVESQDERCGTHYTERYEVPSGHEVNVTEQDSPWLDDTPDCPGGLIIHAQEEIVVNGVINGSGEGGEGGEVSQYGGGEEPEQGLNGAGGEGGKGGQSGGGQLSGFDNLQTPLSPGFRKLYNLPDGGAGGGGGGCGDVDRGSYQATKCGPPGADGSALVVLMAPSVEINGEIDLRGEEGEDGTRCEDGEWRDDFAEPGSGGGAGGSLVLASPSVSGTGEINMTGGQGGEGAECTFGNSDLDDNGWPENFYDTTGDSGGSGSDGRIICHDPDSSFC